MYLDETATKLLVFLMAALIVMIFIGIAFIFETNKECKELRQENRNLLQEKNEILHAVDEAITAARAARRETYRAAFERNMKRNTADPARHERSEII